MPGISHLTFSLMLVIPIMYLMKDKFNYKVAFIFVLNNWVGPDSYWAWGFIPFEMHALLGFIIWAVPLSLFYSYLSRFSIERSNRFFTIVDDGKRDVSWKNSYLLCVAGGTFHLFIDTLFHGAPYGIDLFPGEFGITNPTLTGINDWAYHGINYGYSDLLIIVGFVAMIAAALLVIHFLGKKVKDVVLFLGALMIFVAFSQLVLGWQTFMEREMAATFYTVIFIFLPLMAFAYVMNDVNKNPTEPTAPLMNGETLLKLVAIIALIIGVGFLFLGMSVFFAPYLTETILHGMIGPEALMPIGLVVAVLAGIGTVGAIGLFFKNNYCRYMVLFISVLLWFFIFPFAIALALSRKDIKEMFM